MHAHNGSSEIPLRHFCYAVSHLYTACPTLALKNLLWVFKWTRRGK